MPVAATLIRTEGLSKHYRGVRALDGCTLAVQAGEVFGLLGPNGSGKTTLLRLLLGFLRPTAGAATIAGHDCWADSVAAHRRLAYMPAEARLFAHMKGRDLLRFFADVHPRGDFARALRVAERLDLDISRRALFCSSGMRQKIALAATLSNRAELAILDEPTANLDPTARREVLRMVSEARDEGRTTVFSSHVLPEVEQACDRAALLRYGQLAELIDVRGVRKQRRLLLRCDGPLPPAPANVAAEIETLDLGGGRYELLAPGELAPLLGWLAGLPLADLRVEPVGLQGLYDRHHPPEVE